MSRFAPIGGARYCPEHHGLMDPTDPTERCDMADAWLDFEDEPCRPVAMFVRRRDARRAMR